MRNFKMLNLARWLVLSSVWLWAASTAQVGRVLILDDFESPDSAQKWEGGVQLSKERSSHGTHSAQVRFEPGHAQISTTKLSQDWRSYDRLLFDIYCDREEGSMAGIRI